MARQPIDTAEDWFQTGEMAFNGGKPEQALYALEMSVEIALKTVLISMRVEVPKVHDIRRVARTFLAENKALPKPFRDNFDTYIATFETLLSIRSMVGYGFEGEKEKKELEAQAKSLIPECARIIRACEEAIRKAGT